MRARRVFLCVLIGSLALAAVAAARDPRAEKLALRPADVRLAKQAVLQASDLTSGWRRLPVPTTRSEEPPPNCPGYRPDFSNFTVTGRADSVFVSQPPGASVVSHVEVYATSTQARADFAVSTPPAATRCIGSTLQRRAANNPAGVIFKLVSARRVSAPRVGERSAAYRFVTQLTKGATGIKVYIDVTIVLRGRSIGGAFFFGAGKPVGDQQRVAARIAARLR